MYVNEVKGKGCIVARVVADSMSESASIRITTLELEYPRWIHGELLTHRVFSRNASSSRAIPIKKVIEQVRNDPATPIHWGANQPGMQAEEECNNFVTMPEQSCLEVCTRELAWAEAANSAADIAEAMSGAGYHKQIVNRLLEPFQKMKTVVTATEWDNFFELRAHKDAQPEIAELAMTMKKAMEGSTPERLKEGEWHTPYVNHLRNCTGKLLYTLQGKSHKTTLFDEDMALSAEEALKVSSSCCAQVSYRLLDTSLDKAIQIYDKLISSEPIHASPFEHCATPMKFNGHNECVSEGWTHIDKYGDCWSGNFTGWIQYRQII